TVTILPLHPTSILFPYTTLFRSPDLLFFLGAKSAQSLFQVGTVVCENRNRKQGSIRGSRFADRERPDGNSGRHLHGREQRIESRSEEHTSELQSPDHLVCCLLLE